MQSINWEKPVWSVDLLQRASDAELVRRAQNRQVGMRSSAEAISEIYDRYHERIFRYLWARSSEKQVAEDLTAEVFVRMIANLHQYHVPAGTAPESAIQAWLYRIAHNLLVDYYRKENRRQDLNLEQAELLSEEHGSLVQTVEQRLLFEQIQGALHELNTEQQDVLILRFLIGMPLQEVAQVLGKTLAVVKVTQHRGLKKLRAVLEVAGNEVQDG